MTGLKVRAAKALGIPVTLLSITRNRRANLVSVGKGFRCGSQWIINTDRPFGVGVTLTDAVADLEAKVSEAQS